MKRFKIQASILALLTTLSITAVATFSLPKPFAVPDDVEAGCLIIPENLPATATTGITFPTDSSTILGWINSYDSASIAEHAWGIWAGLTAQTNQTCGGEPLLVFETWVGTSELQELIMIKDDLNQFLGKPLVEKKGRAQLTRPHQNFHGAPNIPQVDSNLWVTVSYNPSAALFTFENSLYNQDTLLQNYYEGPSSIGSIPDYTNSSIAIKPTYLALQRNSNGLFAFPVWPGQPLLPAQVPDFNNPQWQWVFVDPTNSYGNDVPVPVYSPDVTDSTAIANATVNLNQFIYLNIDADMAAFMNQEQAPLQLNSGAIAQAGDIAILAGMHVATKEIKEWTWQSFFWTPDPANPPFPSSAFIATNRLPQTALSDQAAHYAAVNVYNMVWPNQPVTGGTNSNVKPLIGYNPYLEPGLAEFPGIPNTYTQNDSIFRDSTNRLNTQFVWGVQSNCMSCHSLATVNPTVPLWTQTANPPGPSNSLPYTGDQYIDRADPAYKSYVQLDFLWSIQASLFGVSSNPDN